jgi:hypothetical protein
VPEKVRRTPALTAEARRLFEEEVRYNGWQPGGTVPRVAERTGLSADQVRDAIFNESADSWRRDLAHRLKGTTG